MTSASTSPLSTHNRFQTLAPVQSRRRQTPQSRTTTTRSVSRRSTTPISKRSPSPLLSDSGVKSITRKVIRKLEGLGHLDMSEEDEIEDKEEEEKVEKILTGLVNGHAHVGRKDVLNGPSIRHSPSPKLKKIDWEIPRKVLHSSIGFGTIYLYLSQDSPGTVVLALWCAICIIAPADLLRLRYPRFENVYERVLGFLMRESEKHTTNGVIWYILGVNFVLTFYPLDVAVVSVLILSWADTAASTIGRLYGSYTPRLPRYLPVLGLPLAPRKSLAGFLAASATGACIVIGFWGFVAPFRNVEDLTWQWETGIRHTPSALSGWAGLGLIALFSGLISGVAEALDLGSLDDNLTLPIISGGCLFGFFKLVGLLFAAWDRFICI